MVLAAPAAVCVLGAVSGSSFLVDVCFLAGAVSCDRVLVPFESTEGPLFELFGFGEALVYRL